MSDSETPWSDTMDVSSPDTQGMGTWAEQYLKALFFARRLERLVRVQHEALRRMADGSRDRCPVCKGEALRCAVLCQQIAGRCVAMEADEALAAHASLRAELERG